MELDIEGIVLRQTPYKEKDAMVNVFTKDGIASFCARSILSINSKNASSCLLYAYSKFNLSSRSDKLSLRKGELIDSFYCIYNSLEQMSLLSLLNEVVFKIAGEDDGRLYPYFLRILYLLKDNFDVLTLGCIFLAKAIMYSGYNLQFEECINCGSKKNIVSVDYNLGGFICNKCLQKNHKEDAIYLKTFRYVFMVNYDDMDKVKLNNNVSFRLIEEFLNYLKQKFELYKWNSWDLFKEINKK